MNGRMAEIDAVLSTKRWGERWGWHDDHRHADRTPAYLPAMQQVRSEFSGLVDVIVKAKLDGRCLQLGMGECDASHAVWRCLFRRVLTLDWRIVAENDVLTKGVDISTPAAIGLAAARGPYDLLFIDAGHLYDDVRRDHIHYGRMVRAGGIIAFHDAAKRPGYETEIQVWRYLDTLGENLHKIGTEVGIAWMTK